MKKYNLLQQKHSYPRVSSLTFPIYSAIAIAKRFALLLQSSGGEFQRCGTNSQTDTLAKVFTGKDRSCVRFQWVRTEMIALPPYRWSFLQQINSFIQLTNIIWVGNTCKALGETLWGSKLNQKSCAQEHTLKFSYKVGKCKPKEGKIWSHRYFHLVVVSKIKCKLRTKNHAAIEGVW